MSSDNTAAQDLPGHSMAGQSSSEQTTVAQSPSGQIETDQTSPVRGAVATPNVGTRTARYPQLLQPPGMAAQCMAGHGLPYQPMLPIDMPVQNMRQNMTPQSSPARRVAANPNVATRMPSYPDALRADGNLPEMITASSFPPSASVLAMDMLAHNRPHPSKETQELQACESPTHNMPTQSMDSQGCAAQETPDHHMTAQHMPTTNLPNPDVPTLVLPHDASPTSSERDIPKHTLSIHYTVDRLKAIGKQCTNRLPPASVVHRMLLYKLQRQSESESLFHDLVESESLFHDLFLRLARTERNFAEQDRVLSAHDYLVSGHEDRVNALEAEISVLRRQQATAMMHERVTTSTRLQESNQGAIRAWATQIAAIEKRVAASEKRIAAIQKRGAATTETRLQEFDEGAFRAWATTEFAAIEKRFVALEKHVAATETRVAATEQADSALVAPSHDLATLDERIDYLENTVAFEIDSLRTGVDTALEHVSKLSDLVRALTIQRSPNAVSEDGSAVSARGSDKPPASVLPVQTNLGHPLELHVPKGSPLVKLKERRSSSGSRVSKGSSSAGVSAAK